MKRVNHGRVAPGRAGCCFRLCSTVNGYTISTVGYYYPDGDIARAGGVRLYETMVFHCNDERVVTDWSELACEGYSYHDAAEAGHEAMVRRYARRRSGK